MVSAAQTAEAETSTSKPSQDRAVTTQPVGALPGADHSEVTKTNGAKAGEAAVILDVVPIKFSSLNLNGKVDYLLGFNRESLKAPLPVLDQDIKKEMEALKEWYRKYEVVESAFFGDLTESASVVSEYERAFPRGSKRTAAEDARKLEALAQAISQRYDELENRLIELAPEPTPDAPGQAQPGDPALAPETALALSVENKLAVLELRRAIGAYKAETNPDNAKRIFDLLWRNAASGAELAQGYEQLSGEGLDSALNIAFGQQGADYAQAILGDDKLQALAIGIELSLADEKFRHPMHAVDLLAKLKDGEFAQVEEIIRAMPGGNPSVDLRTRLNQGLPQEIAKLAFGISAESDKIRAEADKELINCLAKTEPAKMLDYVTHMDAARLSRLNTFCGDELVKLFRDQKLDWRIEELAVSKVKGWIARSEAIELHLAMSPDERGNQRGNFLNAYSVMSRIPAERRMEVENSFADTFKGKRNSRPSVESVFRTMIGDEKTPEFDCLKALWATKPIEADAALLRASIERNLVEWRAAGRPSAELAAFVVFNSKDKQEREQVLSEYKKKHISEYSADLSDGRFKIEKPLAVRAKGYAQEQSAYLPDSYNLAHAALRNDHQTVALLLTTLRGSRFDEMVRNFSNHTGYNFTKWVEDHLSTEKWWEILPANPWDWADRTKKTGGEEYRQIQSQLLELYNRRLREEQRQRTSP